jgi:para-nitrobenzyl esterase
VAARNLNRRTLIRGAGFGALLLAAEGIPRLADAADMTSIAPTRWGPVRGKRVGDVHVFKGIRYGADTGGANRFRPPREPTPWREPIDAFEDGPQCFQRDPLEKSPSAFTALPESEDCLKLNVWTPALRDGGKRPVMVWLHGGGLWRGSAAGDWQAGTALSRTCDVVMVSPNHRINVMGFAGLEALDSRFEGSTNAGMLDLVLALKWVRDNIDAFGGDPANVTIFGQSGGGQKISLLMAMPAARGLFHKAIIMSGPAPITVEIEYASAQARRLLGKLGLGAKSARKIGDVPPATLMRAYYEDFHAHGGYGVLGIIRGFAPAVDGKILPQQPFWNGAPAFSKGIPLLIGSTRTEMTETTLLADPTAPSMSWSAIEQKLRALFGDDANPILEQFRANHPQASPWEVYSVILSDWPTRMFSIRIAEEQAKLHGAPVYMYRTDWRTPVQNGLLMSPHAVDIGFVLDTVDANVGLNGGGAEPHAMAKQMSDAWVTFARTGNPQTPTLPRWAAYDLESRTTMLFDMESRVALDPDGSDRQILEDRMHRFRVVG